jgi:F0F1-type ATP synthase membrane subunit b/b'
MDGRRNIGNLESYLEEAIKNIRDDRAITSALLAEAVSYIKKNESHHKDVGPVAAKYVETLQRSNEQLVKISSLLQKKEQASHQGLSEEDRKDIFDLIGEGEGPDRDV